MAINYSPAGTEEDHLKRWMSNAGNLLNALSSRGTTANRPTTFLFDGRTYFDTSLATNGKPIWYSETASSWVDATGTVV